MRDRTLFLKGFILIFLLSLLLVSCKKNETGPAANIPATIGKTAPDFTLQDIKGRAWKLSDLRGKVVFINFWATWCPVCRQEMPSMHALNHDMANEKFEMLTILSNDDPARADNFVTNLGAGFPVLIDPDSKTGKAYGITGVPETYIVDSAGILREKYIGGRAWDSQGAKQMLKRYLP